MAALQTRRRFLTSAAALPFALRAFANPTASNPRWILLGTNTNKGIFRASWNAATGRLGETSKAFVADIPMFVQFA
jgi:hypothetical protein